jgi:hypothetical protein
MLHGDGWLIVFDVSGQPIRPTFKSRKIRSPRVVDTNVSGEPAATTFRIEYITSHLKMKTSVSS